MFDFCFCFVLFLVDRLRLGAQRSALLCAVTQTLALKRMVLCIDGK